MGRPSPLDELVSAEEWAAIDGRYAVPEASPRPLRVCDVCRQPIATHRRCRGCGLLLGAGHLAREGDGRVCARCLAELGR